MRRVLSGLVVIAALGAPMIARAQGTNQAAAEALFDEGKKLMAAGQFAQACPKLAESQRLDPGAGTLLNLASCYERNGQTATAWVTYKEAFATADRSGRKEWAAAATKRVRVLEPTLSKLTIKVEGAAPGLVVKRDGTEVRAAELGVAIPLDPGHHVVEASAPNRVTFTTSVELGAKADARSVDVPALAAAGVGPAVAAPTKTPTDESAPPANTARASHDAGGGTQRILGIVAASGGIVAIGVGTVFGLRASGLKSDASSSCNADLSKCNADGLSKIDDAHSAATISTIGFIAGGVLVAGGAVLYFTAPKGTSTTGKAKTTLVPLLGSVSGVQLQGTF